MNSKTLVAAMLVFLMIIDGSNQLQTNNFIACSNFEMKYIRCMDWCMKNPMQVCPCVNMQKELKECKAKGNSQNVNMKQENQYVHIPRQDEGGDW